MSMVKENMRQPGFTLLDYVPVMMVLLAQQPKGCNLIEDG